MLTRQKRLIQKILHEEGRPLSRDEILTIGRKSITSLGSATVDRTIRKMRENHQLIGVSFPGQPNRYELPSEKEHPHFICRSCEKVFDLDIPMQLPKVALPEGFNVSGGEVVYSGTCPKCIDKPFMSG